VWISDLRLMVSTPAICAPVTAVRPAINPASALAAPVRCGPGTAWGGCWHVFSSSVCHPERDGTWQADTAGWRLPLMKGAKPTPGRLAPAASVPQLGQETCQGRMRR
jgi:hypothetical protein